MILIALMFASQQAAESPAIRSTDVVITGNRMRDALVKCLARSCPPEEEVDAAMNAGGESFAAGRYEEAKAILRRAVSRNKKYAARMPGRISDLYATYADVTEHEGDVRVFRHATLESIAVLRDALGEDHPVALGASARSGDMWVRLGDPVSASSEYNRAANRARRAGNDDIAAGLTFRRAWLAFSARNFALSRRLQAELERSHGDDARFAGLLRVLRARLEMLKNPEKGADALVAALDAGGAAEPVILYEPRYPDLNYLPSGIAAGGGVNLAAARAGTALSSSDILWADIGYWVRPNGKTAEAEVLRPMKGAQWVRPLVRHVEARRYVPFSQDPGGVGVYRVERFTLRPAYANPTGSRIAVRGGDITLHAIDVTKLAQRDGGAPQP